MIEKTDAETIQQYETDASNFHGSLRRLILPENEEELANSIRKAYFSGENITVSGAGTGLVGGRVPLGGTVISMEKMDKLIEIDVEGRLARVSAGVTLGALCEALRGTGLFYPPNPTEINATIGGNIATNASGSRTFKYGPTRGYVKSLRIVLPSGEILDLDRDQIAVNDAFWLEAENGRRIEFNRPHLQMPRVKHAAGYYSSSQMSAIDLFIGSEGTLGVVSSAVLQLEPVPEAVFGAIAFFDNKEKLFEFISSIRNKSRYNNQSDYRQMKGISARLIEFFDAKSLELLRPKYPQLPKDVFGAVWIEQEYARENESIVADVWLREIEQFTPYGSDTWAAFTEQEHERHREFRHELPLATNEIVTQNGQTKINPDVAVPDLHIESLYSFLSEGLTALGLGHVIFGHIGNSHLHTNIFVKTDEEKAQANDFYDKVISFSLSVGGTIAAEHGIGKLKRKYLLQMFGPDGIREMKRIKEVFDPKNRLGVGTLFDEQ